MIYGMYTINIFGVYMSLRKSLFIITQNVVIIYGMYIIDTFGVYMALRKSLF